MSTVASKKPPQQRGKLPRLSRAELESVARRMHVWEADHLWVDEHYDELLARYPEQFIAVKNRRVTASDADLDALLEKVPDSPHTCIKLITRDKTEIVL